MENKRKYKKRLKAKFVHKHPILFFLTSIITISIISVLSLFLWFTARTLDKAPVITETMLKSDGTSNMYDKNNNIIWSDTEIRRDYVKYDDLSDTYINMLLATENETFFEDKGFSDKGILNMLITPILSEIPFLNVQARGGSSIDQQLIKMVAFDTSNESNIDKLERKITELWLARQLNENFTKQEILEFYINKMFLGEGSYGAGTITMTYYGKTLKEIAEPTPENLSKNAIIAGLGQAPSTYNLYDNPEAVRIRRDEVLLSAFNNGYITEAQFKSAKNVDVTLDLKERYWRNKQVQEQVGKYNAYISSTLKQLSDMGYDFKKTPLQIYTHLDPAQQDWLTNTVNTEIYQDDLQQVAVTVADTQTGVIIAQSGGRNEVANGLNRATQLTRSSGSGMKPFIAYGPLLEYFNYGTNSMWDSSPYVYPGTNFVASNYGGYTYGMVTMEFALAMSLNTPVNRALDQVVGSAYAKRFLSGVGLDVKETYARSDALGLNVSTEMTALAYASIANGGNFNKANYISKLVFSDGSEKEIVNKSTVGMKSSTAYILAKMLEKTHAPNMSAKEASIPEFEGYIVKTGTTNYDASFGYGDVAPDSWISGATKSIAVSIWTGYDSPNEPGHWIPVTETMKYTLFKKIMRHYNTGKDTSDWQQPDTVISLGNGYYKPNKTVTTVKQPALINVSDISGQTYNYNNYKRTDTIQQEVKDSGVPKDYVINKWLIDLTPDNKKIYDFYINNDGALPTIIDLYGNTVFTNTE
jgi:penicillin-binding protein 1A